MALATGKRLHEEVAAVCPIDSVRVVTFGDSSTVVPNFTPAATEPQKAAARAIIAAFDWSAEADAAYTEAQNPDRKNLRDAATQAVADIDTYLAIGSPNNAQVVAQVRRISQYTKNVIKRLIQID